MVSWGVLKVYWLLPMYFDDGAATPVSSWTSRRAVCLKSSPGSYGSFGKNPAFVFVPVVFVKNEYFPRNITTPPQLVASIICNPSCPGVCMEVDSWRISVCREPALCMWFKLVLVYRVLHDYARLESHIRHHEKILLQFAQCVNCKKS